MKTGEVSLGEISGLIRRDGILKRLPQEGSVTRDSYAGSVAIENGPINHFRARLGVTSEAAMKSLAPKDRTADIKAIPAGMSLQWLNGALGTRIYIHEMGHHLAHQLLNEQSAGYVQVDGFENVNNFLRNPSLDLFQRLTSEFDADQNHFGGYYVNTSSNGPNELGKRFTDGQRGAIVSAAGSVSEGLLPLGAFACGFKLRKSHPLAGYSLMTFGTLGYLRAAAYPFSAIFSEVRALGGGHDWTNVANLTGISPALTAAAFVTALPALALALYAVEKHGEGRVKDGIALSNLLSSGRISPEDLEAAYAEYPGREKMAKSDGTLMNAAATPLSKADAKSAREFGKALTAAQKEYGRFSNFLVRRFHDRVAEERVKVDGQIPRMSLQDSLQNALEDFSERWKHDRAGAVLAGASTVVGSAVLAASISRIIPDLIIQSRGITPSNMYGVYSLLTKTSQTLGTFLKASVPVAGLAGLAYSYYQAGKVLRDGDAQMLDKAAAVTGAVFSGIAAAGIVVTGLAVPLMLIGIAGQLGTHISKRIVESSEFFEKR